MVRMQVQLSEEQVRKLRRAARRDGVSLAEVVRRCVERGLTGEASRRGLYARAASVIGSFSDREGASDVAEDHDRYLEDAFR